MAAAIWKPFEAEFRKVQSELERRRKDIDEELDLAERKAAYQERLLQGAGKEDARRHRNLDTLFRRQLKLDNDEARAWRLQASERKLSGYRCVAPFILLLSDLDRVNKDSS